jgi:AcrR family transcriptional regulator
MMDTDSDSKLSHRALKKARTRTQILENAIALFRKGGIRSTRSLDIASAADVSPATLFNYFPTKDDLVSAWLRGEITSALSPFSEDSGNRGIRPGLRALCRVLADASCAERELRLEAWRCAGRATDPVDGPPPPLRRLVAREQARARLRGDVDAELLADMIIEAIEGGVIAGLRESADAERVAASLRARIDLVLDGARKRNERVAVPASVPPATSS